jgi:bacterioferritin (cytochrome b1)
MAPEAFLRELDQSVSERLERIDRSGRAAEPGAQIGVAALLTVALKKELEASEEAALWMVGERDVEVKLALARQCGDEAKHYGLIARRLRELGVEPPADPLAGGYSPMFDFLRSLETTIERVAAGQFTREALAKVHNALFIEYCEARGDEATARLYREVIQPDEGHHHELGRRLLARLARSEADQQLARRASARTLELAEELQELTRLKSGIARAPGC